MFAVALWDQSQTSLLLARDHFGEKPLYILDGSVHALDPDYDAMLLSTGPFPFVRKPVSKPMMAFASTHAAIEVLQIEADFEDRPPRKAPEEFDGPRLSNLLQQGYEDVRSAAPSQSGYEAQASHWQIFGRHRIRADGTLIEDESSSELFQDFAPGAVTRQGTGYKRFGGLMPPTRGTLSAERVDGLLRQAVARRVQSDVPLGALLSGGVDSSLVSLFAKQASGQLRTFSVKMPDARYDESEIAAQVARQIGSVHTTLPCDARPAEDLQRLITELGAPFGDSSLLPTYWVSRAAREHVKVVLTGDGGDELFAGYERHTATLLLRKWALPIAFLPASMLPDRDPKSKWSKLRRLVDVARTGCVWELSHVFGRHDIQHLFKGTRFPIAREHGYGACPGVSDIGTVLSIGLDYLTGDLLRKVDTASMAVALESRAPFLDSDLVAAVHAANPHDLMPRGRQGGRKGLLRQVARKYLPAEIVDRPKMGFAIPIGEWFRSNYGGLRTMLLDHLNSTEPFGPPSLAIDLNMAFIRQMLDEHLGTGPSGLVKRDHSQRLYMLLVLSIWAKWLGGLNKGG
jgi:asparagine synthase (glutamine-hydrolysing)